MYMRTKPTPSNFFRYVNRTYIPTVLPISQCASGNYSVVCPFRGASMTSESASLVFTLSFVVATLAVLATFLFLWRLDQDFVKKVDKTKLEFEKAGHDPLTLNPTMQAEYARSYLDGRWMDSQAQVDLALGRVKKRQASDMLNVRKSLAAIGAGAQESAIQLFGQAPAKERVSMRR